MTVHAACKALETSSSTFTQQEYTSKPKALSPRVKTLGTTLHAPTPACLLRERAAVDSAETVYLQEGNFKKGKINCKYFF